MRVDVINRTKFPIRKKDIQEKALKAAGFFKYIQEISIVFVTKQEIKKLNKILFVLTKHLPSIHTASLSGLHEVPSSTVSPNLA